MTFPGTTTLVPAGSEVGLAGRYTEFGEVRFGRGAGRVVWRDGNREPLPLDLAPTRARPAVYGIQLPLRYAFGI